VDDFFWPLIVRGLGLSLLFVPLTTLALGGLAPRDVPQGTGLNNMMRQLGGSFGIALITTILHLREGYHRNVLLQNINVYNPAFSERYNETINGMLGKGMSLASAQQAAYAAIEGAVTKQTYLLSYMDGFFFVGVFFIFCIPLLYLQPFKRGSAGGGMAGAH
jgi:MFS transporter, DHA2 family, multidrug resistance protein